MYGTFYCSRTLRMTENNGLGNSNFMLPAGGEKKEKQYEHLTEVFNYN